MSPDQDLETELRETANRFHAAFPQQPWLLKAIAANRGHKEGARRGGRSRIIGELALSGLVLLAVAALAVGIARARGIPATSPPQPATSVSAATSTTPAMVYPAGDLAAAGLSGVPQLITPEDLAGKNGGEGVTLIGAYADSARTVLIFRLGQVASLADVELYDSQGFMNGSTSGGVAAPGDAVFVLNLGPRVASDGLAHLSATLGLGPDFQSQPKGTAAFSFALKVQPAIALPAPAHFAMGSWSVTTEKFEATPSVIHFQAVIAGATPEQFQTSIGDVLDASGQALRVIAASAGVTVPKQQLNASNYANTRVDLQWVRPAAGGTYQLRLQAPPGTRTFTFSLGPA